MYDDILVPTDGSDTARRAIEPACEIGANHDARIHVIYVVDVGMVDGAPAMSVEELREALTEEGERSVAEMAAAFEEAGLETTTTVCEGRPAAEITAYAETGDIDLAVMATHGRQGRERFVVGSVTERVIEQDVVPVLTVPSE